MCDPEESAIVPVQKHTHKHPQADISRAKLTRTVFFSLYSGRRPGPLGTVQTPWECVP